MYVMNVSSGCPFSEPDVGESNVCYTGIGGKIVAITPVSKEVAGLLI